jgi:hypothetical protein
VQGGQGERRGETRRMGDEARGRRGVRATRREGDEVRGRRGAREMRQEVDEARGRSLTACSSHSVISVVLTEYKNAHNCILK